MNWETTKSKIKVYYSQYTLIKSYEIKNVYKFIIFIFIFKIFDNYMCVCVCVCVCVLWKQRKTKSSRYHCCSNYEIVKIQMHLQSIYFIIIFFYRCVDLGKKIKNIIYLFSFGQSMEKTK
jgi:hypothetical protein